MLHDRRDCQLNQTRFPNTVALKILNFNSIHEQVCRWLDDADRIVAYNGQTFDLPFIAHKAGSLAHLDEWQARLLYWMFAVPNP